MNEPVIQNKVKLDNTNAVAVFKSGHQALAEIEGLRGLLIKGLILNYFIFFVVTLILNGLIYFSVLSPFIIWVFGGGDGFWASIGTVVLWSIQLTVAAVIALVALRFSVELMSFWYQSLVNRIIKNFRQIEERTFSIKMLMSELKYIMKEALKSCLFPVLLLLVGLMPLIGFPLVFVLESHLLGRQSVIVYLESLTDQEEVDELRKRWRWIPIRIGWFPTILAFIPFIGWLFLPLTLTYEVVGFAYLVEKSRFS